MRRVKRVERVPEKVGASLQSVDHAPHQSCASRAFDVDDGVDAAALDADQIFFRVGAGERAGCLRRVRCERRRARARSAARISSRELAVGDGKRVDDHHARSANRLTEPAEEEGRIGGGSAGLDSDLDVETLLRDSVEIDIETSGVIQLIIEMRDVHEGALL